MKSVRFTDHALQEIAERKISFDEIVSLLRRAIQIVPDEDDEDRTIYQEKILSRRGKHLLLRAVVEESDKEILVITAYLTQRVKRYWREEQ
jgi:hypothetical protein